MSRIDPKFIQYFPGSFGNIPSWRGVSGLNPIESFEYDESVHIFENGALQALTMWLKVPSWYKPGKQINLKASHYSPGSTNNFKFQTTAYLVRKNTDAITSTTNLRTSTNGDVLNTLSNQLREVSYDLTDSTGKINSVSVSPGDLIKVVIQRIAPSGTADTNEVRMISGSTEVTF